MAMAKEDEIGALWERTSGSGNRFMSGKVRVGDVEQEVVIFFNIHKQEGERTPDWRVYRSQPRDAPIQRQGPVPAQRGQRQAGGMSQRAERPRDDLDDEIPF